MKSEKGLSILFTCYIIGLVLLICGVLISEIDVATQIVIFIASFLPLFIMIAMGDERKRIRYLKRNGIKIDAIITDVLYDSKDTKKKLSGMGYIIFCYAIYNDKIYYYRSHKLASLNMDEVIKKNKITTMPVYVSKNDYSNYYMDVSELRGIDK